MFLFSITLLCKGVSTTLCKAGQYYETALQLCRSCEIPCRMSKNACSKMGCAGYLSTTTPSEPDINEKSGNGIILEYIRKLQAALNERRDNDIVYEHLCMWIPVAAVALIFIILLVGIVIMRKEQFCFSKSEDTKPLVRSASASASADKACPEKTSWSSSNKQLYFEVSTQSPIDLPGRKESQCCCVPVGDGGGKLSRSSSELLLPPVSQCELKASMKEETQAQPGGGETDGWDTYYGSVRKLKV